VECPNVDVSSTVVELAVSDIRRLII